MGAVTIEGHGFLIGIGFLIRPLTAAGTSLQQSYSARR